MATLLMIKEKIKIIYANYRSVIMPIVKGLVALIMLLTINDQIGYMAKLDNLTLVLLLSVVCAFMPKVITLLVGLAVTLSHIYVLSPELALIGVAIFAVMVLLYIRFCSDDIYLLILVPLSFSFNLPYIMPLLVGVLCGPLAALTLSCGIVIYYYIDFISANAITIQGMSASGAMDKIRIGIDGLIQNEAMFLAIISFAAATLVVHVLRKQSIDYAWSIAIFSGAMLNVVLNFLGILVLDNGPSILGLLLGTVISVPLAILIGFLFLGLDYSRTERVQFEDEDYYYYVKAVPKMNIQAPDKKVKKINTQRNYTHYK